MSRVRWSQLILYCLAIVLIGLLASGLSTFAPTMSIVEPSVLTVHTSLGKRLQAHVEYLASPELKGRKPGTPGNQTAAEYIAQRFSQAGLEPLPSLNGYRQLISTKIGDNVMGMRPSRSARSQDRWILIGAHYDHLGESDGKIYAGADDNAAAVAILIETALNTISLKGNHPILFVAFNAEEPPYIRTPLMGSQYFIDHLPSEIRSPSNLQAVIIMDLMGGVHWDPLQNTVFSAGSELTPGLYQHVKQAATPTQTGDELLVRPIGLHTIEEIPLMGRTPFSDYDAFRNKSVPFLFLSAGRTPRYHQPSDLPDTLHYERMASTILWLEDLLGRIDKDLNPYSFIPNRIEFADEVATFRPLIAKAADWGTRIPGTSLASLQKLKWDAEWLNNVKPDRIHDDDLNRLERASLRMQCLLADFPGCSLL